MIHRATVGTGKTSDNALNNQIVGNLNFNDMIQTAPFFKKKLVQSLGLRQRSRETVQNKPFFAVIFVQTFRNQRNDHFIRDKIPFVDQSFCLQPQRSPRTTCVAQHLARRQVRNFQTVTQQPSLRPLAASGRSHQDQMFAVTDHFRRPLSFAFFNSPSY